MNKKFYIYSFLALVLVIGGMVWSSYTSVEVEKGKVDLARMKLPESTLAGTRCERAQARPVAVMLSSDPETRPLSAVGEAEIVFEMPVTDRGVTRMMAVFQCAQPKEIGSVRSARLDFIPLAQGLGAIYAHWGGEKEALSQLDGGVIDNLDAMKYEGTVYYRKPGLKRPHNGFTSFELLQKEITRRGFNLSKAAVSYPHQAEKSKGVTSPPTLYTEKWQVSWQYDPVSNSYERWRDNKKEIDRNNNQAVRAKNVAVLKTTWSPINKDYIRVKTVGSDAATVYQNGAAVEGTWQKNSLKDKLYFYDTEGKEIKFVTGPVWVEIVVE